jgi:hypothetical protein
LNSLEKLRLFSAFAMSLSPLGQLRRALPLDGVCGGETASVFPMQLVQQGEHQHR